MNRWLALYRFAWGFLAVVFVTITIGIFLPKCNLLKELNRKKAAIQEEKRNIDRQTQELIIKQEKIASDVKFLERVARDEIGLVKNNETIFKFASVKAGK